MKKDKNHSFNTPEGYFENFNERLMDNIKKQETEIAEPLIPTNDGFNAPDGYFDDVTTSVLSKTTEKETKVVPLRSNRKLYYGVAAIAAVFMLIFSITWNSNSTSISFDDLVSSEIETYLENNDLDMTMYEVAEIIPLKEIELNNIFSDVLEDDAILEYLNENVDDIDNLYFEDLDHE